MHLSSQEVEIRRALSVISAQQYCTEPEAYQDVLERAVEMRALRQVAAGGGDCFFVIVPYLHEVHEELRRGGNQPLHVRCTAHHFLALRNTNPSTRKKKRTKGRNESTYDLPTSR